MTEKERVESVRFFLKKNKTEFAKVLGYTTPQSYTSYLSGKSNASIKMIKSLIKHDNRFNINWILFGQGQMLLNNDISSEPKIINGDGNIAQVANNSNNTINSNNSNNNELELLKNKIEHLKTALEEKDERLKDKDERLKDKDELITLLKKNQK